MARATTLVLAVEVSQTTHHCHVEATSVRMEDNVTTTVAPACVHPTMQVLTVQS